MSNKLEFPFTNAVGVAYSLVDPHHNVPQDKLHKFKLRMSFLETHGQLVNSADYMLEQFAEILKFHSSSYTDLARPYWSPAIFNPWDVFSSCIQFYDLHSNPIPDNLRPPVDDVNSFFGGMLNREGKVLLKDQFSLLMDITHNHLTSAALLGMMGSRIIARNLDTRAYPDICMTDNLQDSLIDKLAPIEIFGNEQEKLDPVGDHYYFWTHFFAACALSAIGTEGMKMQKVFERGTSIMVKVRRYIAQQPTISDHREASMLGRNLGLAMHAYITEENN